MDTRKYILSEKEPNYCTQQHIIIVVPSKLIPRETCQGKIGQVDIPLYTKTATICTRAKIYTM